MSYSVNDTLIDAGDEWEGFYNVSNVLLTHAHFDHIYGLNRVIELNPNVQIYTNEPGREMLLNARKNLSYYHNTPFILFNTSRIVTVADGEDVEVGNGLMAKSIFTPGHNPSCISWVIEDEIFTGDSYIPGMKVVTNLPGGNKEQAKDSEAKILKLAQNRKIYSGHMLNLPGHR